MPSLIFPVTYFLSYLFNSEDAEHPIIGVPNPTRRTWKANPILVLKKHSRVSSTLKEYALLC